MLWKKKKKVPEVSDDTNRPVGEQDRYVTWNLKSNIKAQINTEI